MTLPTITPTTNRIIALDVLRGFALLGILVMNIQGFSMPEAAYFIPTTYGDLQGVNWWVWTLSHVFADQKFMAIFSMLFGAGIVLMSGQGYTKRVHPTGLHYSRTFWLLIFGLIHAYLIWSGDILTAYAICGALVYWLRNLSAPRLLFIGIVVLLVSPLLMFGSYLSLGMAPAEVSQEIIAAFSPTQAELADELQAYRGGWLSQMAARVPSAISMHTEGLLFYLLWRAGGMMLIGMALFKWGVLTAERSMRFYITIALLGLCIGVPLSSYGVQANFAADWDALYSRFGPGAQFNYFGSVLVALAYVSIVMICIKTRFWSGLQNRLAAVGQMALTNYLLHTILATFIFYGHGLGFFGYVDRWQQVLIVLAIWLLQLFASPVWLKHFRFGPFEWLWRSLTYRRLQPMRRREA